MDAMIRAILLRIIGREERRLGQSLDYVRFIVRASLRAFRAFSRIFGIAAYRRRLPPDPLNIARIVAVRREDCGTCLQVAINIARREGLPAEAIRAAVAGAAHGLPDDLALVLRFADGEEALRDDLRRRFGDEGLVEIALAIASARFFPSVKRTLGYATSCARVTLEI